MKATKNKLIYNSVTFGRVIVAYLVCMLLESTGNMSRSLGGQLIPITKVGEWIGANDATYGYERRGDTDFIVTSGISAWSILFKTGCKSEYVRIRIMPERR